MVMTRHSTRGIRITEYGRWRDARRRLIERLDEKCVVMVKDENSGQG